MTFKINPFYMGSKFENISDDHSYVPCSVLLVQYLFSFPALILMLLSVHKEIAVGICLLCVVSLLCLY